MVKKTNIPLPPRIWGIPLFLFTLSGFTSVIFWGAYWTLPIAIASVVALLLFLNSLQNRTSKGIWCSMVILCIGGMVAAAAHPNAPLAGALMIGSITSMAVMVAGSMLAWVLRSSNLGDDGEGHKQWEQILDALKMSENAKLVLFRDRELDLFRTTVQEDITRGEFHSALVLCDQMAKVYGAVEESELLRVKVQEIIHEHHEARIRGELAGLQQILDQHKWVEAYQCAAKLRRLFPESPLLHGLEQHIADVRTIYRNGLEERFLAAAKREDAMQAMALLRELDGYLTPDEARRFRDTAKSVITTFKSTLGASFKMAVNDHRWKEAWEIGEEVIRQFPNTKMAEEVRVLLETMKAKAEEDKASS